MSLKCKCYRSLFEKDWIWNVKLPSAPKRCFKCKKGILILLRRWARNIWQHLQRAFIIGGLLCLIAGVTVSISSYCVKFPKDRSSVSTISIGALIHIDLSAAGCTRCGGWSRSRKCCGRVIISLRCRPTEAAIGRRVAADLAWQYSLKSSSEIAIEYCIDDLAKK